jgi:hypothetical protein
MSGVGGISAPVASAAAAAQGETAAQVIPSLAVINLLNLAGVPWPYVNECDVWKFADLVRQFSQAVTTTHQEATQALNGIAQAYQGAATQAMQSGWANLTNTQVGLLTGACQTLATALDAAGWYIRGQKVWAIGVLAAMTGEIIVDQVLAVETLGLSELAAVGTVALVRKVQQALISAIQQYIAGQLIAAAAQKLFALIQPLMSGLDWSQSGVTAGTPQTVSLNQAAVAQQTAVLQQLAGSLSTQASSLAAEIRQLQFI